MVVDIEFLNWFLSLCVYYLKMEGSEDKEICSTDGAIFGPNHTECV